MELCDTLEISVDGREQPEVGVEQGVFSNVPVSVGVGPPASGDTCLPVSCGGVREGAPGVKRVEQTL